MSPAPFIIGGFVLLLAAVWWRQVGRHVIATSPGVSRVDDRRRAFNRLVDGAAEAARSNGNVVHFPSSSLPGIQCLARRHQAECRVLLVALRDAGARGLSIPEIYELPVENPRARLLNLREQGHTIEQDTSHVPARQVLVQESREERNVG